MRRRPIDRPITAVHAAPGSCSGSVESARSNRSGRLPAAGRFGLALVFIGGVPAAGEAQPDRGVSAGCPDAVIIQPSTRYGAGPVKRFLLGNGYRDLWATPLCVPVLDLATYGGGLRPLRAGGGNQTRTLHFEGGDGRRYVFRSVDKYAEAALPEELQGTPVGALIQDHISAFHPTGALAVPPLLAATGVLHVAPVLAVMPDDARLGEHRGVFAGMLGQIEERPDEGSDGAPGFADAAEVVDMEEFLERLRAGPADRPDARAYLAARLLDFVVGDTDRGTDQWRWAGYEESGSHVWRPIPRDRDWAFLRSTGLLARVARSVFPKLVTFGPEYPSLSGLVFSSIHHDRRLLAELDRAAWDSAVAAVRIGLSDAAIDAAAAALPPEHRSSVAGDMVRGLRGRREALVDIAASFYDYLAGAADVHGTDGADLAEVDVLPDGSVNVRLLRRSVSVAAFPVEGPAVPPARPYFERRFVPDETGEVRIDLGDGDDSAIVRGGTSKIVVRVIGGAGDDVLADSSDGGDGGARIAFYDAAGRNSIDRGPATRIDRRPFERPEDPDDWMERKVVRGRYRDWGSTRSVRPVLEVREDAGLVLGIGSTTTRYGFRHVPRASRLLIQGLYAPGTGQFGLELVADRTWENSPWSAWLRADATRFDALRFYGFGNESEADHDVALVVHDRVRLTPGLGVALAPGAHVAFGLRADYAAPRYARDSPIADEAPLGSRPFGTVGAWAEAELRRTRGAADSSSGIRVTAGTSAAATLASSWGVFGEAFAEARTHVTFGPTLALRAGGRSLWGDFPVQEAAFVGGRQTLRGHRYQRFAGDAAFYGGAELRAPLTRAMLLVRGELGLLGFADAGRVFVDGASPGGWHTATGGGVWFSSLGTAVSVTYAVGEERRLYLSLGLPF